MIAVTTLENLYHGNINPCDSEKLLNNPEYQKLISLTSLAQDKLVESLTDKQKKLFDNYVANAEELSVIIEEETFKYAFSLAIKIMNEIQG